MMFRTVTSGLLVMLVCLIIGSVFNHTKLIELRRNHQQSLMVSQRRMTVSIFTSPKGFGDEDDARRQKRTIESWIAQAPYVKKIFLLGSGEGYDEVAQLYDGMNDVRVIVDPRIDTNFLGVPLFHSMILRGLAADTDIAIVLNSDIHLHNDVMPGLEKVFRRFENFVAISARWDIGDVQDILDVLTPEQVHEYIHSNGVLHTYGGVDLWAFDVGADKLPLTQTPIPPFVYGRGKYDNWLTHEMIAGGYRNVVDVSEAITTFHLAHGYKHVQNGKKKQEKKGNYWSLSKKSSWELFLNIHLALKEGSYKNQDGTPIHSPWKMATCYDYSDTQANFCIRKRLRPAMCPCEFSNFVKQTQNDPQWNNATNKYVCGKSSVDQKRDYEIPVVWKPTEKEKNPTPGLPHTMEDLLSQVAKEKTIILTAASFEYRDMVMSFVCNLRSLGVNHFLIGAFDEHMYKYLYLRGVPVFYDDAAAEMQNSQVLSKPDDCRYGSACFRKLTKLKSRTVLKILKLGYNVLWSDADIVWFADHTNQLLDMAHKSSKLGLLIQSNEPDIAKPANGIRRINSGYYLAMSSKETIRWFQKIIDTAAKTSLSEQPSFYDVLCGEKGEFRRGKNYCEREGYQTELLDRMKYPNGATLNLWNLTGVELTRQYPDVAILHNNWIKGLDEKIARQQERGWFFWLPEIDSCRQSWMTTLM
jgi:hypothetical protein